MISKTEVVVEMFLIKRVLDYIPTKSVGIALDLTAGYMKKRRSAACLEPDERLELTVGYMKKRRSAACLETDERLKLTVG